MLYLNQLPVESSSCTRCKLRRQFVSSVLLPINNVEESEPNLSTYTLPLSLNIILVEKVKKMSLIIGFIFWLPEMKSQS